MKKETTTPAPTGIISKLSSFVDQRPGFNLDNYFSPYENSEQRKNGLKCYRNDYSEALKDKHSYYELLNLAYSLCPYIHDCNNLENMIFNELKNNSGRLTLDEQNNLQYCSGQYFPTEYRAAACRIIVSVLWDLVRKRNPEFTGIDIRNFIRKKLRTKNSKLYFN